MRHLVVKKRWIYFSSIIVLILTIPLIAMQFTNEVNWTIGDFFVAALLLIGTAFLIEVCYTKIKHNNFKTILIILCILLLVGIWVELAVGIFN